MKRTATFLLLLACGLTAAQAHAQGDCPQFWTVHSIYVKAGMEDAARHFYETSWLPVEREAKKRGLLSDYHLLVSQIPNNTPQIELISIYANHDQFDARVANYAKIATELKLPTTVKGDGKRRDELISTELGQDDYRERSGPGGQGCELPAVPAAKP